MGAMEADGAHGGKLLFGIYIPVIDPNNPQARAMMNMETQGGRLPLPGLYLAIPYGTDPARAFVMAVAQLAQKRRRPVPTVDITKVTDGPAAQRGIIAKSYRVNNQVVQSEVQQQIQLNNAYTNAVLARAHARQQAFDQKLAHDRANADARDRSFQAFDNVLLDQTVVEDTYRNTHGTISNDYADALVKANPNRLHYVPTQDYLKGIDY